ncbi:MAG: tetratricopeptide repeat protein [Burkholderiales bacterium]
MPGRLQEALRSHLRGDLQVAARLYRKIVAESPADLEAVRLLADVEYRLGHREDAGLLMRRAMAAGTDAAAFGKAVVAALEARGKCWEQLEICQAALAADAHDVRALNRRGNLLVGLQRQAEALASYDEALALDPNYSSALYNRGNVLLALARTSEALACFDRVLALNPRDADACVDRGNALLELGRFEDALASYEQALALAPDSTRAHYNRGLALVRLGRAVAALEAFDDALARDPDFVAALASRGITLRERGRPGEALASLERALALDPANPTLLAQRAHVLLDLGRHTDALSAYDRALDGDPDNPDLLVHRGNVLLAMKRHEDALASFDRALALAPDHPAALNNRGNALLLLRRPADALASYDRVLARAPSLVQAAINRGNALRELGRLEEALTSFARASEALPTSIEALANQAMVLRDLRRYDDAARTFTRLGELAPDHAYVDGDIVDCQLHASNWDDLPRRIRGVVDGVRNGRKTVLPFPFLAISQSPSEQLACARVFAADRYPATTTPLWTGTCYGHERIRVAYLSADLHEHATAYLMAEFFELHDRHRFETIAVSFGPDARGGMRARLERSFERFIDVRTRSDREIAELLRALEVDLAVDLKGYTRDCRPGILAHRPAPVQISYLGYPGTMGADYVDYIIADPWVIPPEHDAHYAEKVIRLPDSYQVNDRQRRIADSAPTRTEVGLPSSEFVFCCFNSNYKITPEVFDVWMHLLKEVDGSVLWLLDGYPQATANLRREAQRRGVAPERLVFAPVKPLDHHLARYRLADLFLDTLPCNAHTTASDALWAGLPVLTCVGDAFAARVGSSLLNAVDLPELITYDLDAYQALAEALANDPEMLARLRTRLKRNHATCALFDADRTRRHIESAYELVWARCQQQAAPAAIAVAPIAR